MPPDLASFGKGLSFLAFANVWTTNTCFPKSELMYKMPHLYSKCTQIWGSCCYMSSREGRQGLGGPERKRQLKLREAGLAWWKWHKTRSAEFCCYQTIWLWTGNFSSLFPHLWDGESHISGKHCWGGWRRKHIYSFLSLPFSVAKYLLRDATICWAPTKCQAPVSLSFPNNWKCFHKCQTWRDMVPKVGCHFDTNSHTPQPACDSPLWEGDMASGSLVYSTVSSTGDGRASIFPFFHSQFPLYF